MSSAFRVNRREFFIGSLGAGTSLMIGFLLPGCNNKQEAAQSSAVNGEFQPNAWLRIAADDRITVIVPESEMGQGVMTSIPMIVADELDADWQMVGYEQAPVSPAFGTQSTGGSTSVRHAWTHARQAAAIARTLLISAAAAQWQVGEAQCRSEKGKVIHAETSRQLTYGELVQAAASLPLPKSALLKQPGEFTIIGQPLGHLDAPVKLTGEAVFGLDVERPDMLVATIAHCPVFGGTVAGFDDSKTRTVAGVKHVLALDSTSPNSAVAVVATAYWAAKKGLEALAINWDYGQNASVNNRTIDERLKNNLEAPAESIDEYGDKSLLKSATAERVEAVYDASFQAHATMEPMNCTAHVSEERCEIWAPTQAPTRAKEAAAHYLPRRPADNIIVHTTFLGGGFGRRLNPDFVVEAVQIAVAVKKPVKLIWSRSEDMQHDQYRPITRHRLTATLDAASSSLTWQHRITGPGQGSSAGGAADVPYRFDYRHIDFVPTPTHVPTGPWRSVGHSQNAFVVESFIDELAHKKQQDPFQFRLSLLRGKPRHKRVLQLAAEKAGWGKPTAEGRYQGIALWASFGSYVAQVAEVSVNQDRGIKVHHVVCAIDCGIVINPDTVKAQMQGAIVFGMTAALKGKIDIQDGAVVQSNFHDFPLLGIGEMPTIETYIVSNTESPGGVGEPGLPPIAPAIANAVFAASGKRVRTLPLAL